MHSFGWKPKAEQLLQCRQNEIWRQQDGGRAVPTQIGHEPGRLEAQGQTVVQCRQKKNLQQQKSSGAVQIRRGLHTFGWEPRVEQQLSAGRAIAAEQ